MEQSYFIQYIQRFFAGLVLQYVTLFNDAKTQPGYLHLRMLKKEYSDSGKWESVQSVNTLVMADIVAFDSPLPLKKRDSISRASGNIPKQGLELQLNETQLNELDNLASRPNMTETLMAKLFGDTKKVIGAVYERNEEIFLRGLSTGVTLIEDTETVGTGFRVDYGYLTANKFGVSVLWSSASTAKPYDDFQRVIAKARDTDGNVITNVMMDRTAFNNMVKTTQIMDLFAFNIGYNGATRAQPNLTQVNNLFQEEFGFTIEIVDRTMKYEKNGSQTTVRPWATGAVVCLTSDQVGSLVWAQLAEMNHPVSGVEYQTADNYILVSKFRQNRPTLGEFTNSQARVVPVIANVTDIYLIDSTTVQS
ncbi:MULTISPECIES: major capsid protein [unclassified Spirosoma]|uniref:major capsid protein n=1 Tax=unclassified Spirosoma TaxID=2621999 RepID=UPI000968A65C|nr:MULTISPECIES: major capsid protein [unclassified Spirosoma]MBN8821279.1 major capsid protein [Spirosoma sp.]OJW78068.1 MAG: hypothetical protein BGO59_29050 [Spirosoma sp. 48-14]